jgi:hypothetical protein
MICIGKHGFFRVSGEIKRKNRVNGETGAPGTVLREQMREWSTSEKT